MKFRTLAFGALAALAVSGSASAQTESLSFSIENNSEYVITAIYYGQSSGDDWSDDILTGVIGTGDTVEITIDDGLEGCMYDFAYEFDDGDTYIERVNMCELDGTVHEFSS